MTHSNIGKFEKVRQFKSKKITGTILCGDAYEFLEAMKSNSCDLIFLDPPFNLGKKYCKKYPKLDMKPEQEYKEWFKKILDESIRVLQPGGTLFLYHIPKWAMHFGAYLEDKLNFFHWITISMKNGFVRGNRLYPAHYSLLMYTKGKPNIFNRPKLKPVACRHCGGYIKDYGGYKSIIENKGINLSDVWDDVSPIRHQSKKNRAANELPEIIFERIFQMSGTPNNLYIDPFAGSGSGVIFASKYGMKFKCCDILMDNCHIINDRLSKLC